MSAWKIRQSALTPANSFAPIQWVPTNACVDQDMGETTAARKVVKNLQQENIFTLHLVNDF